MQDSIDVWCDISPPLSEILSFPSPLYLYTPNGNLLLFVRRGIAAVLVAYVRTLPSLLL